jgi:hypothetical protein
MQLTNRFRNAALLCLGTFRRFNRQHEMMLVAAGKVPKNCLASGLRSSEMFPSTPKIVNLLWFRYINVFFDKRPKHTLALANEIGFPWFS